MSEFQALLDKCKSWRAAGFHQAIVDSITKIDNYQYDKDLSLALAGAYNEMPNHELNAERAIRLLLPHAEAMYQDPEWNYQIALCYLYLDRPQRALAHGVRVLEKDENFPKIQDLMEKAVGGVQAVFTDRNFSDRVDAFWKAFEGQLDALDKLVKDFDAKPDRLIDAVTALLQPAIKGLQFGITIEDNKPNLILAINDLTDAFKVWRLTFKVPEAVQGRWVIHAGHPATDSGEVSVGGLTPDDVTVWIDEAESNNAFLAIKVYSDKVAALVAEKGKDLAQRDVAGLITLLLGDVTRLRYLYSLSIEEKRPEGEGFSLTTLPDVLAKRGAELSGDLNAMLNEKMGYQLKANTEDERLRADVSHGITQHARLISEWYEETPYTFDRFFDDGVSAAMIVLDLPEGEKTDDPGKRLDFAAKVAGHLINLLGDEHIRVTGLASGLKHVYIDCLCWHYLRVKAASKVVAEGLHCPAALFQLLDNRFSADDLLAWNPDDSNEGAEGEEGQA